MADGWNESAAKDPLASLCNIEAEQGLLGAILVNNKAFEHVADLVSQMDFGHPAHGRIYSAIAGLVGNGRPATPATLVAVIKDDPTIAASYLGQLVEAAITVVNAPHYAQIIADLSRRREIVAASQEAIADAVVVDPERGADLVLDEAAERLFRISERTTGPNGPVSLGQMVCTVIGKIEEAYKAGGALTVDTGLTDLDRIITGMGAGDLCVMAGRPSMGKSALASTIAYNAGRLGKRVLMFSLEMSREELAQRWIAGLTGIQTDKQRHGNLETTEWTTLMEAPAFLGKLPIMVDDQPRLSVAQMRQRARRARRRTGLDLIIVDHLQLIRQGGKQESRRLEIGDATSSLKAIAKELKVPVLLLSQLNRAVEHRENKRPGLADLKESGDIEQDADVVMFLYREEYYLERNEPRHKPGQTQDALYAERADWEDRLSAVKGIAEIAVAKNRHGRTGSITARFDAERQRFENLARMR